jgi:ABC-type multidrug transport system ATPase subunit
VLQTGGLLKDITVRETLALTASLFADTRPIEEVMQRAGISDRGAAGSACARAASSSDCASRWRCSATPDC